MCGTGLSLGAAVIVPTLRNHECIGPHWTGVAQQLTGHPSPRPVWPQCPLTYPSHSYTPLAMCIRLSDAHLSKPPRRPGWRISGTRCSGARWRGRDEISGPHSVDKRTGRSFKSAPARAFASLPNLRALMVRQTAQCGAGSRTITTFATLPNSTRRADANYGGDRRGVGPVAARPI